MISIPTKAYAVHQIWIGDNKPKSMEGVKHAALAAGLSYNLWTLADLRAVYGSMPLFDFFDRLVDFLPTPTAFAFISDFFRLRLLKDAPGLYLDADIAITQDKPFPAMPTGAQVYFINEFFATPAPSQSMLYTRSQQAARLAADAAAERIESLLQPRARGAIARFIDAAHRLRLPRILGPAWFRSHVIPLWEREGVTYAPFPAGYTAHEFKGRKSAEPGYFLHSHAWTWHINRDMAASYWQAQAERAAMHEEQPPTPRQSLLAAYGLGKRADPQRVTPSHIGKVHIPSKGTARATATPRAPAATLSTPAQKTLLHPARHWLAIPPGTRRIVIFSNITRQFSPAAVGLKPGDLCLHCNRARHAAAAMQTPGTAHWLFVRSGKQKKARVWFTPQDFSNFQKVVFIETTHFRRLFSWYKEFKNRSQASPTTGFILANSMKELAPHLPLILAGFAPGEQEHGSYLWHGHDWELERAWYKEKRFFIIPPRPQ